LQGAWRKGEHMRCFSQGVSIRESWADPKKIYKLGGLKDLINERFLWNTKKIQGNFE